MVAFGYSGPTVHIAVGVLMEQHDLDEARATALIIASASRSARTVSDLAVEIVADPRRMVVDGQQPG